MRKKISPMVCSIIFIMSQACFASDITLPSPDFDEIARLQLALILCSIAQEKRQLEIRFFIGSRLLDAEWESTLQRYSQNAQTNLSWPRQDLRAAQTKAYCDLHYQAQLAQRQDVINFIQHGW